MATQLRLFPQYILVTNTDDAGWMATSDDYYPAFGCITIPTAFTRTAKPEVVLKAMQSLNPDAIIEVQTRVGGTIVSFVSNDYDERTKAMRGII